MTFDQGTGLLVLGPGEVLRVVSGSVRTLMSPEGDILEISVGDDGAMLYGENVLQEGECQISP